MMDPAQVLEAREIKRHLVINDTIARGDSQVQQFYAGAVVLVTGGTGFLGKQLIEKLFRAFSLEKVFVLLRTKKQKTIAERLTKLLEDPLYEYLHKTQPDFVNKIVPVAGDVTESRLGICDTDWSTIVEQTSIIFHGAATTNFTEPLKKATLTNVNGTREIIRLAKECKKLKSFVHVSTAYTHATLERVEKPVLEKFYESPMAPDTLMDVVKGSDEGDLNIMTAQLIKGWPNTYAFTKAVAEEEVRTKAGDLPVCIVRPAIVICALQEPLPGWLDRSTAFGPSGIVLGSGLGILHVIYADVKTNLDLVPVDFVNNAAIIAAQETAARHQRGENDIKIYTVSSSRNPINYGKVIELISTKGRNFPTIASIWYCFAFAVKNRFLYSVVSWLMHYIPGFIVDGILLLIGKKPILSEVYNKVYKLMDVLGYFSINTWYLSDSNLQQLYSKLSPSDSIIFNCNVQTIDWTLYIVLWCIGGRKYIVRDGLQNTEKARRRQVWFRILHYITMLLYIYLIYKILYVTFIFFHHYLFSFKSVN